MKTIAYTCPYVPAEWIAAHGLQPRRLIPLPTEADSVAPRIEGLCPYARAFVNEAAADTAIDGIVVTTLCDQMRRVYDLLVRESDKPAFLLNVPKTWQTVAAQRLYLDELKRLGGFLVHLGGRTPSNKELAKTMIEYMQRAPVAAVAGNESGVPIAVVGGPLMQRDRILFDLIEQCGGRIVLDATETGQRARRRPFDRRRLADDPLLELADAYFSIPDASRRPNSELYEWLKAELATTGTRGIVFHHYVWCDAWRAEFTRLKEWVGLPVLGLDSDGHSETNLARSQNRIRAFLEMLQ